MKGTPLELTAALLAWEVGVGLLVWLLLRWARN